MPNIYDFLPDNSTAKKVLTQVKNAQAKKKATTNPIKKPTKYNPQVKRKKRNSKKRKAKPKSGSVDKLISILPENSQAATTIRKVKSMQEEINTQQHDKKVETKAVDNIKKTLQAFGIKNNEEKSGSVNTQKTDSIQTRVANNIKNQMEKIATIQEAAIEAKTQSELAEAAANKKKYEEIMKQSGEPIGWEAPDKPSFNPITNLEWQSLYGKARDNRWKTAGISESKKAKPSLILIGGVILFIALVYFLIKK